MNLFDALKSIIKPHDKDPLTPLSTLWGENLDPDHVLPEYPRPQMQRDSFLSLNGYWDCAFTDTAVPPTLFEEKILVPFSPECLLSGIGRQLQPGEFLWYRTFLPPAAALDASHMRTILHFGAVDHTAVIYVNGHQAAFHEGGYLPFYADITDLLEESGNELLVKVQDPSDQGSQSRGKQTLRRGGIFYTAQSGIWQSVWLEQVPPTHLEAIRFETDYDSRKVTIHITAVLENGDRQIPRTTFSVRCKEQDISGHLLSPVHPSHWKKDSASTGKRAQTYSASLSFTIPDAFFYSWSPNAPFLYRVCLTLDNDQIQSYFAMRVYSVEPCAFPSGEIPVFCLNHKPFFLMGVLDQGYWPESLYTAPSDEALLYDITTMKSLGFNMLRKHIKVENARWYYHCDRLGMIVCQDMVNGGSRYRMPFINYLPTLFPKLSLHLKDSHYTLFSRRDEQARRQWEQECLKTIDYLRFFPSIAIWVPFNEGWGQFDAARITSLIKTRDSHRLVDSASGWFDQGCGDFISIHNYFRPLSVPVKKWGKRAFFLSEYGGFACHIKNHSSVERVFGYKRYECLAQFQSCYHELIKKSLLPLKTQGLCGAVYTQLSDVEEEVNGILTYDRRINKLQ